MFHRSLVQKISNCFESWFKVVWWWRKQSFEIFKDFPVCLQILFSWLIISKLLLVCSAATDNCSVWARKCTSSGRQLWGWAHFTVFESAELYSKKKSVTPIPTGNSGHYHDEANKCVWKLLPRLGPRARDTSWSCWWWWNRWLSPQAFGLVCP